MPDSTPAALPTGATPLLQTVGLTKRYGNFLANDSIDIDICYCAGAVQIRVPNRLRPRLAVFGGLL